MGIEINGTPKPPVGDTQQSQQNKKTEGASTNAGTGVDANAQADNKANADSVSLTNSGVKLNELESRINEIPEVDHEKIHAIRQKIAAGEYNVDAKSIAQKLIQIEARLPR